jgi:hypothetical protein
MLDDGAWPANPLTPPQIRQPFLFLFAFRNQMPEGEFLSLLKRSALSRHSDYPE